MYFNVLFAVKHFHIFPLRILLRGDFLQTRVFFWKIAQNAILVLQVFQKYLRKISIFTHFFACLMRNNCYI